MKKQIIIIAGLVSVIMTPPASAVTQCLPLDMDNCEINQTPSEYATTWKVDCGEFLYGIAACSPTPAYMGITSTIEMPSDTESEYLFCFCRIMSPIKMRSWALANTTVENAICHRDCARKCAESFLLSDSYLRKAFEDNFLR